MYFLILSIILVLLSMYIWVQEREKHRLENELLKTGRKLNQIAIANFELGRQLSLYKYELRARNAAESHENWSELGDTLLP